MFYFKYQVADWVKQYGLPQHHLRIVLTHVDANFQRWYRIFDTTLGRTQADYGWILADVLESNSALVERAKSQAHALEILGRCQANCCLKYSIPRRQDCESLQRFIQTGREDDRWSPQVWTGIAAAVIVGLFFFGGNS